MPNGSNLITSGCHKTRGWRCRTNEARAFHNLVSLFGMRFLTHLRAHLLNRKNFRTSQAKTRGERRSGGKRPFLDGNKLAFFLHLQGLFVDDPLGQAVFSGHLLDEV
jgi:hypothetical protein